jgi:hypothetical protein
MKENTPAVKAVGIGFSGLLTLLFITLKLTGFINWSWWLVLLPILIPWAIVLGVFGLIGAGLLFVWWESRRIQKRLRAEIDAAAAQGGRRQTWAKGSWDV